MVFRDVQGTRVQSRAGAGLLAGVLLLRRHQACSDQITMLLVT